VESCTALAEDFEGNIHLLRLDDSKQTTIGDPAAGSDTTADRTRMRKSERSACRSVPMNPVGDITSLSGDLPLFRSTGPSSRDPRTQAAPLQHLRRQT
jgi:hypothetical protein